MSPEELKATAKDALACDPGAMVRIPAKDALALAEALISPPDRIGIEIDLPHLKQQLLTILRERLEPVVGKPMTTRRWIHAANLAEPPVVLHPQLVTCLPCGSAYFRFAVE